MFDRGVVGGNTPKPCERVDPHPPSCGVLLEVAVFDARSL